MKSLKPKLDALLYEPEATISKTKQMTLQERYMLLIHEIEGLYQDLLFKDLPPYDDTRIHLLAQLIQTGISEATYILNYLHKTRAIDGDICEFGVAQGATSALMAYEISTTNKSIWLFDSFRGLSKPTKNDTLKDDIFHLGSIEEYEGTMAYGIHEVMKRLDTIHFPLSRVKIVPGFIEETICSANLPERVSFAYLDFDLYEPTLLTLNFLDEILQTNGTIIVDDYDFFSTGCKKAVDEFMAKGKSKYNFSLPVKSAGFFCILEKVST